MPKGCGTVIYFNFTTINLTYYYIQTHTYILCLLYFTQLCEMGQENYNDQIPEAFNVYVTQLKS